MEVNNAARFSSPHHVNVPELGSRYLQAVHHRRRVTAEYPRWMRGSKALDDAFSLLPHLQLIPTSFLCKHALIRHHQFAAFNQAATRSTQVLVLTGRETPIITRCRQDLVDSLDIRPGHDRPAVSTSQHSQRMVSWGISHSYRHISPKAILELRIDLPLPPLRRSRP